MTKTQKDQIVRYLTLNLLKTDETLRAAKSHLGFVSHEIRRLRRLYASMGKELLTIGTTMKSYSLAEEALSRHKQQMRKLMAQRKQRSTEAKGQQKKILELKKQYAELSNYIFWFADTK